MVGCAYSVQTYQPQTAKTQQKHFRSSYSYMLKVVHVSLEVTFFMDKQMILIDTEFFFVYPDGTASLWSGICAAKSYP